MSTKQDQDIALALLVNAVNAGDAARYASVYTSNAVITIHGGGVLLGRAAIEAHEVELLREFPGARLAFEHVWHLGDAVVVHYAVNAPTAGGPTMGHRGLLFLRFHASGLIVQEHRYMDSFTPMAQMGALSGMRPRPPPTLADAPIVCAAGATALEAANVALVRSSFADLDAQKMPSYLCRFTDDAVLDELMYADACRGPADLKTWFRLWSRALPDSNTQITWIMGAGDCVLAETVVSGTLQGMLGRVRPSGQRIEFHRAVIVRLKAGKFTQVTGFMNGKELAEAAGWWPVPTGW